MCNTYSYMKMHHEVFCNTSMWSMQANEFAGALGWSLTADEERELHTLSKKVQPVRGFPVEAF